MTFKETPDAWQTKLQGAIPFPWFWIAVSFSIYLLAWAIIEIFEESPDTYQIFILEAVALAALANAAVYFEMLLDEVADTFPAVLNQAPEKTDEWLKKWYNTIFWSHSNLYVGGGFGLLFALLGWPVIPDLLFSIAGRILGFSMLFFLGFLTGSLVWFMIGIARMTYAVGKEVDIRPSIFDTSTSPLRAAASVVLKVSFTGALLFILGASIYPVCSVNVSQTQVTVWALGGFALTFYFIASQINIHKSLKKLKRSRLDSLVVQIDNTFDKVTENPSMDNINKLKELFGVQKAVDDKGSWSFGTRELLTLIGSIIIPLILFGLNLMFGGRD